MKTEAQIVDEICRDAHNGDWSPDTMATLVCEAVAIGVERERARFDWLARNLMCISTPTAPDMGGIRYVGQLRNEARGSGGGPSYFRVNHRDLRQAIDDAMNWKKP